MILFNDASLHGQFDSPEPFRESLRNLWDVRSFLVEKGLHLKVCRSVRNRNVTPSQTFYEVMGTMPREIKTRLLLWLDREGPHWDDNRLHSDTEYFECGNVVVTDTGAAEAAAYQSDGGSPWIFSINPSDFLTNPLVVRWLGRAEGDLTLSLSNGWTQEHAAECAASCERPLSSWSDLMDWACRECRHLELSGSILEQLPTQFLSNVANRSQVLLGALNEIVGHLKSSNPSAFNQLRCEWMQGNRARFSPSSESELREFSAELTFRHPYTGASILCSWHGKIQTPQYRIHFEWPLPEGAEKLFVAYIGPKITKR